MKEDLKKGVKSKRLEEYITKKQREDYRGKGQEYHVGLSQNLNPGKTVAIMTILDQMAEILVETHYDGSCRICTQHSETVKHLVAGTVNI